MSNILLSPESSLERLCGEERESGHHTLEVFKSNPERYKPSNIESLDLKFEEVPDGICENCRFDVKFTAEAGSPRLEELKSYAENSWDRIKSSRPFLKQFKSYLSSAEVNSLNDFSYVINSDKASITYVKEAFRDMFKNNARSIFEVKPAFFKQFDTFDGTRKIRDWEDLKDLVLHSDFSLDHPILSFIN